MAQLVILVPASDSDVSLNTGAVEALARLGVTAVSMARDRNTVALVFEGWAFDPTRQEAVLSALGAQSIGARALQPVVQMSVNPVTSEGGFQ